MRHHVTVRCDHSALIHYRTTPEPMHQVARHLDLLNTFDIDIEYIQGERNVVPDFLSRIEPCNRGPDGEPCKQCTRRVIGHSRVTRASVPFSTVPTVASICALGQDSTTTRFGRVSRPSRRSSDFHYAGPARRPRLAITADISDATVHDVVTDSLVVDSVPDDVICDVYDRSDGRRVDDVFTANDLPLNDSQSSPANANDHASHLVGHGEVPRSTVDDSELVLASPVVSPFTDISSTAAVSTDIVRTDMLEQTAHLVDSSVSGSVLPVSSPLTADNDLSVPADSQRDENHSPTPADRNTVPVSNDDVIDGPVHATRAQQAASRRRRKAVVLSHLHQRAPLAVTSGAQFWDNPFFAKEQAADVDIAKFLQLFNDDSVEWDAVKHLSATVRAFW